MKKIITLFSLFISYFSIAQLPALVAPEGTGGYTPDWIQPIDKVASDSCGPYFNNYVGLTKTTTVFFEPLRTGDGSDFTPYSGRGQRFHAPQPIEVSGIQFYSFQTNPDVDSLMVITVLYDWDEDLDSIGVELARDSVYVKHTEFTPLLTELEVNSFFEPVVVEEDYVVALYTETNDSLKILRNSDVDSDGEGEAVSFAYYDNPTAPSFTGWYQTFETFGPGYDIDYLINPLVNYDLHEGFLILDDSICPDVLSAGCVEYDQLPVFSDPHYNRNSDAPTATIGWTWGDGLQVLGVADPCHTYEESGTFEIMLIDSLRRHDFETPSCEVNVTQNIVVLDSITASAFSDVIANTASFNGLTEGADSVAWDFGDGSPWSTELNTEHVYDALGEFTVWFYVYGPCNTDSLSFTVFIDDVGINENHIHFSIYPNPSDDGVSITDILPGTQIQVVSMTGQVITELTSNSSTETIATSHYAAGTYFVKVTNDQGTATKKLVVQH